MEARGIDKDTKKMLRDFIHVLFKYFKDVQINLKFKS